MMPALRVPNAPKVAGAKIIVRARAVTVSVSAASARVVTTATRV